MITNEKRANDFDMELYRLAERAAFNGDTPGMRASIKRQWQQIAYHLRAVRTDVRAMMSKKDREETA